MNQVETFNKRQNVKKELENDKKKRQDEIND